VIVSDRESGSKPLAAYLVLIKSGERRRITHPPDDAIEDHCFSMSPDGKSLVFARMIGSYASDLYRAPLTGGSERRLTQLNMWIFGSAFLPDGHGLLFAVQKLDEPSLWRLSLDTMTQDLISDGPALMPSAVRSRFAKGSAVAFQRKASCTVMMEIDPATKSPHAIMSSTRMDVLAQYSPDSQRIAFASNREGSWAIFVCDWSGSISRKIAPLPENKSAGAPRWSPDGRYIAYDSRAGDHRQVVVADVKAAISVCWSLDRATTAGRPGPATAARSISLRLAEGPARFGGCRRPGARPHQSQGTADSKRSSQATVCITSGIARRRASGELSPMGDQRNWSVNP
jgi:Tol biopolymer transport system component